MQICFFFCYLCCSNVKTYYLYLNYFNFCFFLETYMNRQGRVGNAVLTAEIFKIGSEVNLGLRFGAFDGSVCPARRNADNKVFFRRPYIHQLSIALPAVSYMRVMMRLQTG